MKKSIFSCFLAATLLACSVQPVPEQSGPQPYVLTASLEGQPDTRTVVQDETKVFWQPGDAVKLFFNGNGSRFTSTNTEPVAVADFTGTLNVVIGFNEGFPAESPLWGLYPYREDATADNSSVTTTLPAAQNAQAGSFAPETYITLGQSSSLTMGFYAVCGGVRFSLTQEGIKLVRFEGLDGEALAGRIQVAFGDGVPQVLKISEEQHAITLRTPDGSAFQTGQWYYIVTLPGTLEKGFRMTFRRGSRSAEYVRESPVTIKRSIFGTLAEVDKGLDFKIPGIGDPDEAILFADEKIKARLVTAFDKNGDGEISYNEADEVTSLADVFKGQNDYTSFDEFRFFTGVTEIPMVMCRNWTALESITLPESLTKINSHAFYGCSKLGAVDIPENVTVIDRYAFYGCSAIQQISLPDRLESIGDWAFYGTALTTLKVPSSVRTIGSCAFRNCAQLAEITLPSDLEELGASLFYGCKALTHVDIPASVTKIGSSAFYNCSSLDGIQLPEALESIEAGAFYGCAGLGNITLPGGITTIGSNAFEGCAGLSEITIPSAVTSIGAGAFRSCTGLLQVRVLPALPPAGGEGMFSNTGECPIYIPGATASHYSEALYWKDYVNRLRSDDGSSIYYTSTNYARDGEVVVLQTATVGRGVNFILMGDGFVDRDMEPGGIYEQRMRSAMESLFAYEPYRSERARFNVYAVKVISSNAQYNSAQSNRRFTYDSNGEINFRSSVCDSYGLRVPNSTGQPLKMAVLCNSSTRVGRSYCLRWTSGKACCILYDPNGNVLVHELCGHGFGDLADEYSEHNEPFTDQSGLDREWTSYGWNANVDWRSDPAAIRWAHFLSDSRYADEGLGVYEGAKTYATGIYRPSYNSMMRYNNCPFNAPSREQIYKNIMRWSVGSGWTYDYETFVAQDAAGREQAQGKLRSLSANSAGEEKTLEQRHAEEHVPPVWVDDDVTETAIPLEGKPIVRITRRKI